MSNLTTDRLSRWGVLIFLAFIWGSSFILMKIGLVNIPYEEVGALRMLVAFFALLPFGFRGWLKIEKQYWKFLLVVGLCGNGFPAFLFAYAQSYINSSLAGMLNSLVPMFTLIIGLIVFKVAPKSKQLIGVFTGLIGAFLLLYQPGMTLDSSSFYGIYVVAATICYAISVNTIKRFLQDIPSIVVTSASLLFVGPICGLYLFLFTGFPERLSMDPDFLKSFIAIITLSVLATGFALVIFNMLIKRVSALYASSVTYLIPVIAIFWGVLDGESFRMLQFAGMAAILGGVYLINK